MEKNAKKTLNLNSKVPWTFKNKNGGFLARDFVVASIVFFGIFALFVVIVGAGANTYDNTEMVDPEFSERFDRLNNVTDNVKTMWEETSGKEGLQLTGNFDVLFKSGFTVISLTFGIVKEVGNQVFGFTEFFGIPSEVATILFVIIFSITATWIVFVIVSSATRRDI